MLERNAVVLYCIVLYVIKQDGEETIIERAGCENNWATIISGVKKLDRRKMYTTRGEMCI